MASTTIPISCIIATAKLSPFSPHPFPRHAKISLNPNAPRRDTTISCEASSSSNEADPKNSVPSSHNISETKFDRRNVLLGLGGLYGAYNFIPSDPFALASPVPAPDIKTCGEATISFSTDKVPYSCCPPFSGTISDYKVPSFSRLNVRPAAHKVDKAYLKKYKTAIKKMKELPCDDPRNFYQQANVHCAYCNGAYKLAGAPYDIHPSWLFFPFHRWYLYFYERILQSLINDPTFALPYWNWDNPPGMYFPRIFEDDESSPLYDELRNPEHSGGFIMDLAYAGEDVFAKEERVRKNNLAIMYRQMVTNAPCPLLFFGAALRAEGYDTVSANGAIVNVPHNSVHRWVGDPRTDHNEDMGNFYSAAKDPIFYCHHANVDRMWIIWKTLGGKRKDIADPDYLRSEFLFYDEHKNLVKVNIGDCLDNEKLGYTFQEMPTPWKNYKLTRKRKIALRSAKSIPSEADVLPTTLNKILTFKVTRPKTSRTKADKEEKEELLNLGLEYDDTKYIRFDVFLNDDEDANVKELDRAEYASSFANLAHVHESGAGGDDKPTTTTWSLPITELLEDLGIEGDDDVVVTLVPKCGGKSMTIKNAVVKLVAC